ncbi:hypothetical protein [Ruania albidiflava]|uniref:hypothetical protein n=1 Tax=Ruania albidiflava TaxID=366586 RepID=UPI0023F01BD6|nr:hypothetical protein [Ruania albidiflava]
MKTSRRSASVPVRAALPAALGLTLLLSACSGAEQLELGSVVALEAQDPLGVDFAVLSVTQSTMAEAGLGGLAGTQLRGQPWLVGYRIELTSDTREDFSWDAVTDLSSAAWVADTGRTEVQASIVNGVGPDDLPCAEQGTEVVEPVLMYGCQVFIVPSGQDIESITVAEVGTWAAVDAS